MNSIFETDLGDVPVPPNMEGYGEMNDRTHV